jgi:hypothetical protein
LLALAMNSDAIATGGSGRSFALTTHRPAECCARAGARARARGR